MKVSTEMLKEFCLRFGEKQKLSVGKEFYEKILSAAGYGRYTKYFYDFQVKLNVRKMKVLRVENASHCSLQCRNFIRTT